MLSSHYCKSNIASLRFGKRSPPVTKLQRFIVVRSPLYAQPCSTIAWRLKQRLVDFKSARCTVTRKSDSSQNHDHSFQKGSTTTYQHFSDAVQQPKDVQAFSSPSKVSRPSFIMKYSLLQTKWYQPLARRPALNHRLVGTSDNANAEHFFSLEFSAYEMKPRHSGCDDRH